MWILLILPGLGLLGVIALVICGVSCRLSGRRDDKKKIADEMRQRLYYRVLYAHCDDDKHRAMQEYLYLCKQQLSKAKGKRKRALAKEMRQRLYEQVIYAHNPDDEQRAMEDYLDLCRDQLGREKVTFQWWPDQKVGGRDTFKFPA